MKFDMGSTTLTTLARSSTGSSGDLEQLIKQLVASVAPLEGKFNGAGRAAFDSFKARTDGITGELNSSLAAIIGGQVGMDTSFETGDTEMSDNARRSESSANFDSARFSAGR